MFEHIDIPMIYEEDIIEFNLKINDAIFKYYTNGKIIEIQFELVYKFDFCDFEYIFNSDWDFGLCKYIDSPDLHSLVKNLKFTNKDINRAFGGEIDKLVHYRMVIDDVGMYDIICKGIMINSIS